MLITHALLAGALSISSLSPSLRTADFLRKEDLRIKARQDGLTRTGLVPRATLRAFIDIRGFPEFDTRPMVPDDEQAVRRALQGARLLAQNMLRVPRGSALYVRIMGDQNCELYDLVMQQVRRVLNIIGDSDGQLPGGEQPADVVDGTITFFRQQTSNNRDTRGDRDPDSVIATSRGGVVLLFESWFRLPEDMGIVPGTEADINDPDIDRAANTRSAIMFHELLHRVSQGQMGAVLDQARDAGARIQDLNSNPPRITDVRMHSFQPQRDNINAISEDGAVLDGIDPEARAYRRELTSRLADLTFGRYAAALNADSYTMLAVAATINIANTVFIPSNLPRPDPSDFPTAQSSIYDDDAAFLENALLGLSENRRIRGSLEYLNKIIPGWLQRDHGSGPF